MGGTHYQMKAQVKRQEEVAKAIYDRPDEQY